MIASATSGLRLRIQVDLTLKEFLDKETFILQVQEVVFSRRLNCYLFELHWTMYILCKNYQPGPFPFMENSNEPSPKIFHWTIFISSPKIYGVLSKKLFSDKFLSAH